VRLAVYRQDLAEILYLS